MFEVEQKFWVDDLAALEEALRSLGALEEPTQQHADEYFNHPSRDFRETKEALRIRRVDGVAHITYKGPKLPGSVKARTEMEWCLSPGDAEGQQTAELWKTLGFRSVAVVRKRRRPFSCSGFDDGISITIDAVADVGLFSEVEILVEEVDKIETARTRVVNVAERLGLRRIEPQSYLNLLLNARSRQET